METVVTINNVTALSKKLHHQHKRIVLVGGCFDLLHFGHITLLEKAKNQGEVLMVLLESDKRIKNLKGNERPLHTQKQRAKMLISLKTVDFVVLLPDKISNNEYDKVVKTIQPAIIATTKGSDSLQFIKKQAKENNAKIYLTPLVKGLSTSRIINSIMKEL